MADATEFSPMGALDIAGLQDGFRGELLHPGDPGYEDARRVWNGSISRFPALIARCAGVADVISAVRFARDTGLLVAVRGGGHSFPGLSVCDSGLLIDLSPMKGIRVDPEARTVTAQAGVLLGELDRETQAFGLVVPSGIVTHTGLSGLTLGGGINWVMRKYGLTIDQLLSVDLITADGEFVKASASENPDLFWGVRGGGGNFGIVTQFEFRLNPVGPIVLAGPIFWPMEESPNVLRFYREWIAEAPDELMTIVVHRKAPPLPFVPLAARQAGRERRVLLCSPSRGRGEGRKTAPGVRLAGARPVRDKTLPRPPSDVRSVVPARVVVLHACLRRCGAHRRGHRHYGRSLTPHQLPADGFPNLAARGGRPRALARKRRPSADAAQVTRLTSPLLPTLVRASTRNGSGSETSGRPSSPTTRASM